MACWKLVVGLLLACFSGQALAQSNFGMPPPAGVFVMGVQVVAACGSGTLATTTPAFLAMNQQGQLCTNASGGGGGGGLSVTDQAPWTQGSSQFTPAGCVFNDTATLSSGQQGTFRCTTDRQQKVLDSAVLAALNSPSLATGAATSANQSTEIASLATIASNTGAPVPAGTFDIGTIGVHSIVNVTPTDCSGTVTSGGTAQNAISASATIHGYEIVNIDTTAECLNISKTGTAAANTAGSACLAPATSTTTGGSYNTPLGAGFNTNLSVIAATTGHKFTCTRW